MEKIKDIRVVGIGASAGGLEALQDFFKAVPPDTGMSFVVVQHLSPDYKSLMDELLARHTSMPINVIKDGTLIEPNNVYLIPPRKNLKIFQGKLFLSNQDANKGLNLPIDIFFKSLAGEKGKNAIGIILSGTGSDGTMGTRAIKEAGGIVMVQDEESAKFSGMPKSSISTGLVDYILHPAAMPEELINFIRHPFVKKTKILEETTKENLDNLSKVILLIKEYNGIDFSYYKENTIIRRLERRVSINRFSTLEEYIVFLEESDKEKEILYRELLIGVTHFFRDKDAFKSLEENVIPEILRSDKEIIRVWSAGCSTGEEVYSIAILLLEAAEKNKFKGEIKIFATDLDKNSIHTAGLGFYPDSILADVDPLLLSKYFKKIENGYKVNEEVRNRIVFASHNLLKDPPFSKLDLLICRNLFIYLKPDIQIRVLSMFYYSLNPEGFLFVGSSETIGTMSDAFNIIDSKNKIFQYKKGFKLPVIPDIPVRDYEKRKVEKSFSIQNKNQQEKLIDKIINAAVNLSMPPSIIVDSNYYIVKIINNINPFTEIQTGNYSRELFSILPKELGLFVNNMLRKLKKEKKPAVFNNISGLNSLQDKSITIEGKVLEIDEVSYYMISFGYSENSDSKISVSKNNNVIDFDDEQKIKVSELEKELQAVKENLNAAVEELETSNEELQSSNEELIASNEELQSTNEELQSVNEELYTVNTEFQMKIEELTQLNNDINNLLRNTEVAALYLDSNMKIRKITSELKKISNVMDSDIGRPVTHIAFMDEYPDLENDVKHVIDSLQSIDKEINTVKGASYFCKIRPYRTQNNAVDGVLVTFVNISVIKKLREDVLIVNERLQEAMNLGKSAWWEWNVNTENVIYSPGKAEMLGYSVQEFPDNVYDICNLIHPNDYADTMQKMKDYLEGRSDEWKFKYRMKKKDGSYLWYYDSGKIKERDENGKPVKLIGSVININDLVSVEEELERSKELLELILENTTVGTTMVNSAGHLVYANKQAEIIFGITKKQILDRSYNAADWEIADEKGNPIPDNELPFSIVKANEKSIHNYKLSVKLPGNNRSLISIDGTPVNGSDGRFIGAVFTMRKVNNE